MLNSYCIGGTPIRTSFPLFRRALSPSSIMAGVPVVSMTQSTPVGYMSQIALRTLNPTGEVSRVCVAPSSFASCIRLGMRSMPMIVLHLRIFAVCANQSLVAF